MTPQQSPAQNDFLWQPQPQAWQAVVRMVTDLAAEEPVIGRLADRMLSETGTRLIDWVAAIRLPQQSSRLQELRHTGFTAAGDHDPPILVNTAGLFPSIAVGSTGSKPRLTIKVDRIADFCNAHNLVDGSGADDEFAPIGNRTQVVHVGTTCELAVFENHGRIVPRSERDLSAQVTDVRQMFATRDRRLNDPLDNFDAFMPLLQRAVESLGTGLACDLFFQTERDYWQSRNRAARVQKSRQDALGLGWANHDHHTYRSSRSCFHRLIEALETLGFTCRERFYAGAQAGWGAQVLEHADAGVIIFADVDLSPEEVADDFAHQPLPDRRELGTVGLWCRLHGEAFFAAGMHHLECQFDFDAARRQLADHGIQTMAPFTDFSYLRQAFTEGEIWPVDPEHLRRAVRDGAVTQAQADRFAHEGAIGSHLEILERNDGYKGFNQTGISDIIHRTDPRN